MSEWDNSNCPLCKRLGVLNSMNKTLKNIRDSLPKRGLLKWMWEVKEMETINLDCGYSIDEEGNIMGCCSDNFVKDTRTQYKEIVKELLDKIKSLGG